MGKLLFFSVLLFLFVSGAVLGVTVPGQEDVEATGEVSTGVLVSLLVLVVLVIVGVVAMRIRAVRHRQQVRELMEEVKDD